VGTTEYDDVIPKLLALKEGPQPGKKLKTCLTALDQRKESLAVVGGEGSSVAAV